MKVVKTETKGKNYIITLHVDDRKLDPIKGIEPSVELLNNFIFNSKKEALEFYSAIIDQNNMAIADNETRLAQMPRDSLEKVNEFAEAINRHKALSNKKADKISDLIKAHDNMRSFEKNIVEITKKNKEVSDIIKAIKKNK